jgi:hypothetical protein
MTVGVAHAEDEQTTFASADEAVSGLVEAVRSGDEEAIVKVLGPSGRDIASSGDPVADKARRTRFLEAFNQRHQVQQEDSAKAVLTVGEDEFPFPIPIVSQDGKWYWDTDQGLDEILTRRIGENELATIDVMRGYVAAQYEFAAEDRDGKGAQYARRLMSQEGKRDGLYWPASTGEDESPIGPLIAEAQSKGYSGTGTGSAYNGYVFRMLYGQGKSAEDGARDYILNGRMIGGFALVATPAEYENSGVMTFIVNQDGVIYEKDLGPETRARAAEIRLFNPDATWKKVRE